MRGIMRHRASTAKERILHTIAIIEDGVPVSGMLAGRLSRKGCAVIRAETSDPTKACRHFKTLDSLTMRVPKGVTSSRSSPSC